MGKNGLKNEVRSKKFDTSYAASIPKKYLDEILIDTKIVANRNVLTLTPKKNTISHKSAVYTQRYFPAQYFQTTLESHHRIDAQDHATFIVPDYHLAPFQTAIDAFKMIEEVYKHLLSITDADNIILMGDSASGGLAMSFVQKLKKEGLPQPQQSRQAQVYANKYI